MKKPRIGVFICHCGNNIAGYVSIPELKKIAGRTRDVVIVKDQKYTCSDQGQAEIKEALRKGLIDRVVVASCSPAMHERTFRRCVSEEGFNPYLYQQADIRENCSWVTDNIEEATKKAAGIIRAAASRAKKLEPLQSSAYPVSPTVLVIGGGIAGITAATDILDAGFQAVLVEREDQLGGWARRIGKGFPHLVSIKDFLEEKLKQLQRHSGLTLYRSSRVTALEGFAGNFKATIKKPDGITTEEEVGSVIIATGFSPFDAAKKTELGYTRYKQVLTTVEMEELLQKDELLINGQPKEVAFIQCVGSRDKSIGKEYCSRACCMVVAKQALLLKKLIPDVKICVFYMDVRAFGKGYEEFFEQAQRSGVRYIRGNPSEVFKDGNKMAIRYEDTLLRRPGEMKTDLVILAVGMEPPPGAFELSTALHVALDKDGFFLEAHPKLGPLDTLAEGIHLAGCCQSPKDLPDTIAQGHGAAARATVYFHKGQVIKEPVVVSVDIAACSGCRLCEGICAFDALRFDERKKVMAVQEAICKGCGACAATCPSGAVSLLHFRRPQLISWTEAFLT